MKSTKKITIDNELNRNPSDMNMTQSNQDREQMIATAAYFRAEKRGFTPNDDQADWFESENEINGLMSVSTTGIA